jgi:hypothetical protein
MEIPPMKKMILTAVAALCVLAFPVAIAEARPGHGGGEHGQRAHGTPDHAAPGQGTSTEPEGDRHGAPQPVTGDAADDPATTTDTPAEGRRHGSRKCKRTHAVGFVVKGSLASYTAETVTLDVKRANRHARSYLAAADSMFTLGSARVRFAGVTDADGNGTVDFADVLPTDKVVAIGKATAPKRGCAGETVLKLRKLQVVRPEAEESDDSGDQS